MAKTYWLKFGSGHPTLTTGLAPTLVQFNNYLGAAITAPGITQPIAGYGLYQFQYGPTISIAFTADGFTTSLAGSDRYLVGSLDPVDAVDETIAGIASGATNSFLAYQAIGTTASSFGTTSTDPGTLYGYLKRLQENLEGNQTFTKATGTLDIYSRGSSTLLIEKALSNSTTAATKT